MNEASLSGRNRDGIRGEKGVRIGTIKKESGKKKLIKSKLNQVLK